jgi:hypothetical protein
MVKEDILSIINNKMAPKDKERQKNGEIFTPLNIVDDMLASLPISVWSNPNLKWLDPANGIGNFPIKAIFGEKGKYLGLDAGLKEKIPDRKKRLEHIIETMIYMIDINHNNNKQCATLFEKICPTAKPNIEMIDEKDGFLTEKPILFGNSKMMEFDIIFGNPPYQSGAVKGKTSQKTLKARKKEGLELSSHRNLWIPFLKKILTTKILKPDGYLLFITPITWFRPESTGIHNLMLQYQIHHLRIIFVTDFQKYFNGKGSISVAHYCLQKSNSTKDTLIIDRYNQRETLKLTEGTIIISGHNQLYQKIRSKCGDFQQSSDYKINSLKDCLAGQHKQIYRIDMHDRIKYLKTKAAHPDQNTPKIVLYGNHWPRIYYDKKGQYGVIGQHQNYFTGQKLNRFHNFLETKLAALLLKNIKYEQEFICPRFLPDIRNLPMDVINDDTLAEYFRFTKTERAIIEETEYPKKEFKFSELKCSDISTPKNRTRKSYGSIPSNTDLV